MRLLAWRREPNAEIVGPGEAEFKLSATAAPPKGAAMNMKKNEFSPGWDEKRVRDVLDHYESQSEQQAVAEDQAAMEDTSQTIMAIPNDLVPKVRELIAGRAT